MASAEIYGKLRAVLEKKGTPLTEPDIRIASIALGHKLVLVTENESNIKTPTKPNLSRIQPTPVPIQFFSYK